MTDGLGARTIGGRFGTGADRGPALVFVLTGVAGLAATTAALRSRPYRRLSRRMKNGGPQPDPAGESAVPS
jgi:DHA3 family multidrug efflux protein-like MFS transporter